MRRKSHVRFGGGLREKGFSNELPRRLPTLCLLTGTAIVDRMIDGVP